tara:strand:- start:66 stop:557 length:492 start_codon:yes stop_codon:yes gene_type:complete
MMDLSIEDSFLSHRECDLLINYFEKHYSQNSHIHDDAHLIRLRDTPTSHRRKSRIRNKLINYVQKKIPSLEFNYDELVKRECGVYREMHLDTSENHSYQWGQVDWTCVCYLNDDFQGGETRIYDRLIKPERGRIVLFKSKSLLHGTNMATSNRYTYTAWWRET